MTDKIVNTKVKKVSNDVDQLFQKVKDIQKNCKHTFLLKKTLKVTPSLIEGISLSQEFTLVCVNCSREKSTSSRVICPCCLSEMIPSKDPNDQWWVNGRQCEAYFGGSEGDFSYYAPRIQVCGQCGWKVVWKEWDQ